MALLIVNSVAEMVDTTQQYVLASTGTIWQYSTTSVTVNPTNRILSATESDGKTLFNGGQGWKTGYNLNAGTGAETSRSNYEVTGFMGKFTMSDILRFKNITIDATTYDNICFYDSSYAFVKTFTGSSTSNPTSQFKQSDGSYVVDLNNLTTTNMTAAQKQKVAFVRIGGLKIDSTSFVTINEPLEPTTETVSAWVDTGVKYQDSSEAVAKLQEDVVALSETVTTLQSVCDKLSRYMGLHV